MMLVPAGFLVLLLLAAIAVDSAAAYLGQRQLADALTAAANDAATAGIDDPTYYRTGQVTLDPSAAAQAVCASLAAQGDGGWHDLRLRVGVAGPEIEVEGHAEVDAVFGRLFPGFATRPVTATVRAQAEQAAGAASTVAPTLVPVTC